MNRRETFRMVLDVMREYRLRRELRKRLVSAPFDTDYLEALIATAQPGVVLEVIQPGGNVIRITKEDRPKTRPGGLDYYDIRHHM